MEEKLKKLSVKMDQEISKGKVFTKEDEQKIIAQISLSVSSNRPFKRFYIIIPQLLTVALFLGIIFTSYYFFEKMPGTKQVTQTNENDPSEIVISKDEAKKIFFSNLSNIKNTLTESGKKNNWNYLNPPSLEILSKDLEPFVTHRFKKTILEKNLPNYYCNCDNGIFPKVNPEVRFQVRSIEENKIEITGIEPATDMTNIGYRWHFRLLKEDNEWKMDYWEEYSLQNSDLKLTKEEAGKLLASETLTSTFYKEVIIKGEKAYVFKVVGEDYNSMVAIYSTDTTLVHDFYKK